MAYFWRVIGSMDNLISNLKLFLEISDLLHNLISFMLIYLRNYVFSFLSYLSLNCSLWIYLKNFKTFSIPLTLSYLCLLLKLHVTKTIINLSYSLGIRGWNKLHTFRENVFNNMKYIYISWFRKQKAKGQGEEKRKVRRLL